MTTEQASVTVVIRFFVALALLLLFEWNYAQLGDIQPKTGEVRHLACGDPERGGYSLLAFSNGFLTGANLINCTHLAGKLRRAILRKWRCESMVGRADGDFTAAAVEEILNECTASC